MSSPIPILLELYIVGLSYIKYKICNMIIVTTEIGNKYIISYWLYEFKYMSTWHSHFSFFDHNGTIGHFRTKWKEDFNMPHSSNTSEDVAFLADLSSRVAVKENQLNAAMNIKFFCSYSKTFSIIVFDDFNFYCRNKLYF